MATTESTKPGKTDPEPVGSSSFTTTGHGTANDPTSLPLSDRTPTAGESSDPVVQHLLAVKQGYQMNRDVLDPPVVDEGALDDLDDLIADVDDKLADLGYPQESQDDRKARLAKAADDAAKKQDEADKRRTDRADARAAKATNRK